MTLPSLARTAVVATVLAVSTLGGWGIRAEEGHRVSAHTLPDAGGIEAFARMHPELKASLERNSPDERARLARMYQLVLFFRNGGAGGYRISDRGTSLETIYKTRIETALSSAGGLMRFWWEPAQFRDNAIAALHRTFQTLPPDDAQRLTRLFVDHPQEVEITPLGAGVLIGGFIRHFGIADDVRLVMTRDSALWLRVRADKGAVHYLRLDESLSAFDASVQEPVLEPTMACIRRYAFAKSVAGSGAGVLNKLFHSHGQKAHEISVFFLDLRFFAPAADILAPRLYDRIFPPLETSSPPRILGRSV